MLEYFEVENYKGFENKIRLDLKSRDYNYNNDIIKDGLVKNAILYGKNGIGKTSLGIALFDIAMILTDKQRMNGIYTQNYINLNSGIDYSTFCYGFNFDGAKVEYLYKKKNIETIIYEKLVFSGKTVFEVDISNKKIINFDSNEFGNINFDAFDEKLSMVKYISRTIPEGKSVLLSKLIKFVNGMLWYRSLSEGNDYFGFMNGGSMLSELILRYNAKDDFEKFLSENDINCNLDFEEQNGKMVLVQKYEHGKALFDSIASTGTKALELFFCWKLMFENLTFLFIDEFDAFFHFEAAENMYSKLRSLKCQSLFTSHNTYLMSNKLTRPDCCFIMTKDSVKSLCDSTDKEIREAHNLEKMYRNGCFEE